MEFNQLWKCMYDFDIFPSVISKNRLYQIFVSLSDIREETSNNYYPMFGGNNKLNTNTNNNINKLQNYLKDDKKI